MYTEYKITPESKKKYLYKIAWTTFSLYLGILLFYFYFNKTSDVYLMVILFLAGTLNWAFLSIPYFVLFYNHYKYSKDIVFSYDSDTCTFVYAKGKKVTTFKMKEVTKVELYLTNVALGKSMDFLFFGKYHYTAIYTEQYPVVCISCLVFDRTTRMFFKDQVTKVGKGLPLIPKEQKEFIPFKEKSRVEQLVEKYVSKSDEELSVILKDQKDYQKEAVEAAVLVLKSREQATDSSGF